MKTARGQAVARVQNQFASEVTKAVAGGQTLDAAYNAKVPRIAKIADDWGITLTAGERQAVLGEGKGMLLQQDRALRAEIANERLALAAETVAQAAARLAMTRQNAMGMTPAQKEQAVLGIRLKMASVRGEGLKPQIKKMKAIGLPVYETAAEVTKRQNDYLAALQEQIDAISGPAVPAAPVSPGASSRREQARAAYKQKTQQLLGMAGG
jgi:hypothetical protein